MHSYYKAVFPVLYHSYIVYHRIACSPWELVGGAGLIVHGEQSGIPGSSNNSNIIHYSHMKTFSIR